MLRMMRSEWLKIRRSFGWMLAAVSPLLAALLVLLDGGDTGDFPWLQALTLMSVLHAMLFLPLLTGIFAALICRYEHMGGGWKLMLSLPVSRTQVYFVKFLLIMLLLACTQALFLLLLLLVGAFEGYSDPIPWTTLLLSTAGGWVACLPLAALQLFVSAAFQSFAAPLAVNVIFTIPNLLVANSERFAPYYPWTQPMLAMMPRDTGGYGALNISAETLFVVVLGSFCAFFAAGWLYFTRKAV